jgi:hypothetical protein
MFSVALVGADGSGKTTLATKLKETCPLPLKYLYMGLSTLKSEPALPTTYLIRYLKIRSYQKKFGRLGDGVSVNSGVFQDYYYYNPAKRGRIWHLASNLNTLADVAYRQAISLIHQKRGFVVIYDRHFLFMNVPLTDDPRLRRQPWTNHWLHWAFDRFFPKPHIVFFLDAPCEVLYERKKEVSIENLEQQREMILTQEEKIPHFVWIDATQPVDEILTDITQHITALYRCRKHSTSTSAQ